MMNQEDIFKKIGQILSELNDQYQYLAQNPQELNDLELELFLANANFLTDHVQIIKKINSKPVQKILPEHTDTQEEVVLQPQVVMLQQEEKVIQPEIETVVQDEEEQQYQEEEDPYQEEEQDQEEEPERETPIILPVTEEIIPEIPAPLPVAEETRPVIEQEMFKLDKEPSTFEFILNEGLSSDKFEFEEKSVDEIFDRPLSKEEEYIIAQKQKLRDKQEEELGQPSFEEEDEIGPEPFLVAKTATETVPEAVIEFEPAQETALEPIPAFEPEPAFSVEDEKPVVQPELFRPVPSAPIQQSNTEEFQPTEKPAAKQTLNDILAGNAGRNVTAGGSKLEITDLKQAISLNDKMRYIKDLFNGYNLAYAEAIDLVNKMPDFRTADAFLQNNYAVKNNWSAKQDTADQFYELLNRRFPAK